MNLALLDASARALVLAVLAGGAGLGLRHPAHKLKLWRGVLYGALLYAVVALPPVAAKMPRLRLPMLRAEFQMPVPIALAPMEVSHPDAIAIPLPPRPATPAAPTRRPLNWMAWTYGAFALALWLRLAIGLWMSWRLRRRAEPMTIEGVEVLVSELIEVPLTVGLFRPAILLPRQWTSWSPATLAAVLAHEGSHRSRHDTRMQFLARVYRALFWFSPLSWWLVNHLEDLAEQASDAAALEAGAEPRAYARAWLDFLTRLHRSRERAWWRGVAMAGRHGRGARRRLDRILNWRLPMTTPSRFASVGLVLFLSAAVSFAAMARPVRRHGKEAAVIAMPIPVITAAAIVPVVEPQQAAQAPATPQVVTSENALRLCAECPLPASPNPADAANEAVTLHLVVASDGSVRSATAATGSDAALADVAAAAVKAWRFQPLHLENVAIDFQTDLLVHFALPSPGSQPLVATVEDAYGNRVSAAQVNYTSSAGNYNVQGRPMYQWNGRVLNAYDYFAPADAPQATEPRPVRPGDKADVTGCLNVVAASGNSRGGLELTPTGPLLHNKLFWFFDNEGTYISLPTTPDPPAAKADVRVTTDQDLDWSPYIGKMVRARGTMVGVDDGSGQQLFLLVQNLDPTAGACPAP